MKELEELKRVIKETYNEDANLSFADIDVEKLYDTIKPERKGVITNNEMEQVKDFLDLRNRTDEELTAIRNSIVRYYADKADIFYEIPRSQHTEEEVEEHFIMQDQMSAFTFVIDSLLYD